MSKESSIKKVTPEEMLQIIDTRKPLGMFYCISTFCKRYVACDNRTGDAWTEDFKSLSGAKNWVENM